eukprot:4629186-Heterocapsa_arctica.AAC.1
MERIISFKCFSCVMSMISCYVGAVASSSHNRVAMVVAEVGALESGFMTYAIQCCRSSSSRAIRQASSAPCLRAGRTSPSPVMAGP